MVSYFWGLETGRNEVVLDLGIFLVHRTVNQKRLADILCTP